MEHQKDDIATDEDVSFAYSRKKNKLEDDEVQEAVKEVQFLNMSKRLARDTKSRGPMIMEALTLVL